MAGEGDRRGSEMLRMKGCMMMASWQKHIIHQYHTKNDVAVHDKGDTEEAIEEEDGATEDVCKAGVTASKGGECVAGSGVRAEGSMQGRGGN